MDRRKPRNDPDLIAGCLAGEPDAWSEFLERYRPMMVEMARRIVPAADAEDVVSSIVVDLWQRRKLARFEGRSTLKTWLGAVVINAALNARRSADSPDARVPLDEDAGDAQMPVQSGGQDHELIAVLADAIASLPPATKTLMLMYYEHELTLDELARVHDTSKSTLSRTLRQAREQIRADADRLARARWGISLEALREGVDLASLDLDVQAACKAKRNALRRTVSKQ